MDTRYTSGGRQTPKPGSASEPMKGLEHAIVLGVRDTRPVVAHTELDPAGRMGHPHLDGRRAVASGVFQEVSDDPAQQTRVAADGHGFAAHLDRLVTRAL